MQKFGLFDLIDKLAPLQKVVNSITNNAQTPPQNSQQNPNKTVENPTKKANISSVISLINRHNEISKRIDNNLKK